MSFSNVTETEILNALYRSGTTLAGHTLTGKPANRYLALFSADPTDAGSGAELFGGGYAREPIPTADASWTAPADNAGSMQITNATLIEMTQTTGNQNGPATHFAIMDAATAGNVMQHGALGASRDVSTAGITIYFDPGDIVLRVG